MLKKKTKQTTFPFLYTTSTIMVNAEVSQVHVIYRRKNTGHGLTFIPTERVRRKSIVLEYRETMRE